LTGEKELQLSEFGTISLLIFENSIKFRCGNLIPSALTNSPFVKKSEFWLSFTSKSMMVQKLLEPFKDMANLNSSKGNFK